MPKKVLNCCLIASFCFLAYPLVSFGQTSLANELNVEVVPQYPRPNELVSVSLEMYTESLDSATITWYQNGKPVLSGKGETRYSFTAGAVGEETRIDIMISFLNGTRLSKGFSISPASVDLIWESNSYTPPFYRGKALHPRQGTLKITASPNFVRSGKQIEAKNLIYKWANDASAYESQSGYGKNVLVLSGSVLGRSENISVTVSDPESDLSAYGYITIKPGNPEIVFYEKNPYYGHLFDEAVVNSMDLKSDEMQIMAAPFYFTNEKNGLKYEWRLNNQAAPSLIASRIAIFKKPEGESGKSLVSLRIENVNRILQQADQSLTINFSN